MRSSRLSHHLVSRVLRAALRSPCRYRVAAIGYNSHGDPIAIVTNSLRSPITRRGWHAEELLIHRCPPSLSRIEIARVGANGEPLPIDPCAHCAKLARKHGVIIRRFEWHA